MAAPDLDAAVYAAAKALILADAWFTDLASVATDPVTGFTKAVANHENGLSRFVWFDQPFDDNPGRGTGKRAGCLADLTLDVGPGSDEGRTATPTFGNRFDPVAPYNGVATVELRATIVGPTPALQPCSKIRQRLLTTFAAGAALSLAGGAVGRFGRATWTQEVGKAAVPGVQPAAGLRRIVVVRAPVAVAYRGP